MNITGIEIIRRNSSVSRNPIAAEVLAGEKLSVMRGDTVRMHVGFDYRGPAMAVTLRCVIGTRRPFPYGFDEIAWGRAVVNLDESSDLRSYTAYADIDTSPVSSGVDYDIYAKIEEYPGQTIAEIADVIEVVEVAPPPEYELIQHTIHPAAYVWEGEAEVCVIEFPLTPEQIPFTQWGGLKIAETLASAVEAEGNSLLEVKVWEDTTPMYWTNYRVEIKAAVASEEQGVAWAWLVAIGAVLASLPWKAIIIGTLTVLGIWIVGWVIERLIKSVDRVIHKPSALTDEVIDALGREDLIPMILYKAQRLEYEVTPEELEAMSDDGLRALLKELRDRQVAEEAEWWPLALIGGVAVLGVGAAAAFAMGRPRK